MLQRSYVHFESSSNERAVRCMRIHKPVHMLDGSARRQRTDNREAVLLETILIEMAALNRS